MNRPSLNFAASNHRPPFVPHFQNKSNFVLRGRGPRYGQQQSYGRPPMQYNNEENWCETCDRGFRNADLLEQHKQEHQKCNIDGCQFIAHPKVITKHIQMQHSTGLFKKIANLKDPDDIKKWREERKKKYPTKVNVEKKAAEIKEKIERGEKMGLKHDKDYRTKKSGEAQKRRNPFDRENFDNRKKVSKPNHGNKDIKKKMPPKIEKELPTVHNNRKLKPFEGIQDLIIETETEDHDNEEQLYYVIEDDDEYIQKAVEIVNSSKTEEPIVCGALSTLMCEYGSSDEESERQPTTPQVETQQTSTTLEIPQETGNLHKNSNIEKNVLSTNIRIPQQYDDSKENKHESEDDSGPEESVIEKKVETPTIDTPPQLVPSKNDDKKPKHKTNMQTRKPFNNRPKKKLPSTLLQKLLQREIQQERNIVLQCIRHIVKNNYFDN